MLVEIMPLKADCPSWAAMPQHGARKPGWAYRQGIMEGRADKLMAESRINDFLRPRVVVRVLFAAGQSFGKDERLYTR